MKKMMTSFAGLLLLLMLLIGCGEVTVEDQTVKVQQSTTETDVGQVDTQLTSTGQSGSDQATFSQADDYRIVSTTVAITQILDVLELDVVGVPTSGKVLPERYDDVTRIGNPMSPDMELVKSLKPTEVLSVTTLQYDLEPVFEDMGVTANFLNLTSVESMNQAIIDLGTRYDRNKQASELVNTFEQKVSEIEQLSANYNKPKVLILMGIPGSYLVATEHSYIGDLVRLAGGVNIVQGETAEYLASNTEYLFQSNPDVILRAAHGMPEEVIKMFDSEFKTNDIWKHFDAVKNDRVFDLEEILFGTTGNYLAIEAIDALLPMLYPELEKN
ncbi:heme ABC transporter substrate-binding protein IsdE [Paenibacillus endoradicis]|uniref:heme ABC transporter substrate-binding protein IsdE n=1 Tax=Paenibacillus endoradicis TaxID=2972487 RepID=UPI0021597D4F|nr:heme ABC transporter substrate-binding protein IsdE [Paenibacillus endoradicis]MCR8657244.1 heme ABC transporter substrate-binding protein IsdE [Paenibacillus endoradicis]